MGGDRRGREEYQALGDWHGCGGEGQGGTWGWAGSAAGRSHAVMGR